MPSPKWIGWLALGTVGATRLLLIAIGAWAAMDLLTSPIAGFVVAIATAIGVVFAHAMHAKDVAPTRKEDVS